MLESVIVIVDTCQGLSVASIPTKHNCIKVCELYFLYLLYFNNIKMIFIKLIEELNIEEKNKCINLINNNFENNRFDTYEKVIFYKCNNDIAGFVGIKENGLNQLCTDIKYRKKGIACNILEIAKSLFNKSIYLYVCKNKKDTEYLFNFYKKSGFVIDIENDIEYKMIFYKN